MEQGEAILQVGIVSAPELSILLEVPFLSGESLFGKGLLRVREEEGQVVLMAEGKEAIRSGEIILMPQSGEGSFRVADVVIGVGFHWEQKEEQVFPGGLKLIPIEGVVQLINQVPVETYLESVISSEMRGDSHPELLKAQTIISRSWVLAQIRKNERIEESGEVYTALKETDDEYIRWYDREDHHDFHVCADDHCQRYQGLGRSRNPAVQQAVEATRGQVLWHGNRLCDARFSKCCGGVVEAFQYCWEAVEHPYLQRVDDNPPEKPINMGDLRIEHNVEEFTKDSPEAFCNTTDPALLSQVLNDYDLSSPDFFRWELSYSQEEISKIIRKRSGIDFGKIYDLVPVERGVSGRLVRLKIVGSKRTLVVGKELEIRRWLSESHLYSSAFIVRREDIREGIPGSFHLRGAGWGHGVGLCQIGAAVMASLGYSHEEILKHYFVDIEILSYESGKI